METGEGGLMIVGVSQVDCLIIVVKGEGRPTALHTQYYTTLHYTTNILLKTTEEDPRWSKTKNK